MKSVPSSSVPQSGLPVKRLSNKRRLELMLKEMIASGGKPLDRRMIHNPMAFYRRVIE